MRTLGCFIAVQGIFAFCGTLISSLEAALTQDINLRVRITDNFPPTSVADLAATPTITPGQILLSWTAPDENLGIQDGFPVVSYEVRYATFSVDDVAGSTTTWWNNATTATGVPTTPQVPGSAEMMVVNLTQGVRYYFGLKSTDDVGNVSDIDTLSSTPGSQSTAITQDPLRPAPVAGISAVSNPDSSFGVDWSQVTLNEDGTAANDISGYLVYRATSPYGPFTSVVSTAPSASATGSNITPTAGADEYYLIVALDNSGNQSDPVQSNLVHITSQGILEQMGLAQDGSLSRASVPQDLLTEMNNSTTDLLIRVQRNTDPALNTDTQRTLRTYSVDLSGPVSTTGDLSFSFSDSRMNVILQYADPSTNVPSDQVGILWWNGNRWIKMGQGQIDSVLNTVSFLTALPGTYQVRQFQPATELTLDKSSVFPRIFTPNGDGINDMVFFVLDNPRLSTIEGKIYDLSGGLVGDLKLAGAGAPTPDTLIWDGKDHQGNPVPAGVYLYQVKGEGKTINGTVVVAK